MAISHTATYGPGAVQTATTSTSSVTCVAGDLLVTWGTANNAGNAIGTPTGGTGLTWTLQRGTTDNANGSAGCWAWTAFPGTGQTYTQSITSTVSGNQWMWGVERFAGVLAIGQSALQEATVTASPSVTLTTTVNDPSIFMVVGDWNGVGTTGATYITASAGTFTQTVALSSSTHITAYAGYYLDAGPAGSETVGMSAPSGMQPSTIAIELQGSTAARQVIPVNQAARFRASSW